MGLFSFLRGAGSDELKKKEVEATKEAVNQANNAAMEAILHSKKVLTLEGIVNSLEIPVTDLSIQLDHDTVTVGGTVASQSDKEKIVLALGNVDGIAVVDDQLIAENQEPEASFYEVKSGDSLSKIAKAYYGDPMKYPVIFEANKPMLKDPNKIYPGQQLRIPKI
ncbi:MAG TPA: peptidoglycan-binding protein LysM [Saprospiraceae bacterium]|jgi:nucleoid-associated protein YgaU|nr:MAG: peptidoglycan-binding lysin domain-containing protein [Candidatus Parvibacillus calidus]MBX2936526.1 peptidoglycan-binding protein LysM [Saprospiraceae bacterium]MBK7739338.1 peptidoglycan-binding protein LysM [Candidatus Parvibacillus calidus]MBX7178642.1 peptidoglycan-binding protein LysM [Saprospiraceae bacterium]MCB0590351.1 peptidoglycan-binding protein LysM [Saprospiraceae bacterium]